MRSAPSVTYPVRPSARARLMLGIIWAAGAGGMGLWCYQMSSMGWRQGVGLAAAGLAGFAAWRAGWRPTCGELHWDGQHWSLAGARTLNAAEATVHLDFQSLLLVRLRQGAGAVWLWLDRRACPSRWLDVRRAVHARSHAADRPDAAASAGDLSGSGR